MKKGCRFTVDSPLNADVKTFLSSFENGSEETVLSYDNMDDTERALSHAVVRDDHKKRKRLTNKLKNESAKKRGVEQQSKNSWWKIVGGVSPVGTYGREPPTDWPRRPPAWDHATVWRCKLTKQPLIAVAQPYPWLLVDKIEQINQFAVDYNFRFRISNFPSWHFPGSCWFIEWWEL